MKIRLAGLGLIALGLAFAWLFIYLPLRDGPSGIMGGVRIQALVFVPLAIVTGLAFVIGGTPALEAFQARPKSRAQLAFVLAIIIGSGVVTGVVYWQIKTRWGPQPKPLDVIPDFKEQIPTVKRPEFQIPPPPPRP